MAIHDPYSWAADFARTSAQVGENAKDRGQQDLLSVFKTEVGRQQPLVDLPIDLAATRAKAEIADEFAQRRESRSAARSQRRYTSNGKTTDAKAAADSGATATGDTVVINGKRYPAPKVAK